MNKFYDRWEASRVLQMTDEYPYQAINHLKEYIVKYPMDYYVQARYASLLVELGFFDEGEEVMNILEKTINRDLSYLFLDNQKKKDIFFKNFYMVKIKLLLFKYKDLPKAYELFKSKWQQLALDDSFYQTFDIVCQKELFNKQYQPHSFEGYLLNQVANYDESEFLSHIEKHMANRLYNNNTNVFGEDFPLEIVFAEIKRLIPNEKRIYYGLNENRYFFKYDNCGRDCNHIVDYFMLVSLHDTQEFITMLPVKNQQGYPAIDLNYLRKEDKKETYPSRIERFNRRLALKKP